MRKIKEAGKEAFDSYYSGLFGERWPGLKAALAGPGKPVAYSTGLTAAYFMDAASVLAAEALMAGRPLLTDDGPEERILDMCAAPGGKTLVIASRMKEGDSLVANERSPDRRNRLARVLADHLPETTAARVSILGKNAATMCRVERNAYDRVLLDAPCSSERHVLASAEHLGLWSPARTKRLAQEQWALLSSAFLVLKPGGILVYSTCALSPLENDGVIERLFSKYGMEAGLEPVPGNPGEATKYGRLVMPDSALFGAARQVGDSGEKAADDRPGEGTGAGPLFICRIGKRMGKDPAADCGAETARRN